MRPFAPGLLLAVAVGGAAGSVLRYVVGVAVHERVGDGTAFPVATLLVNVSGSLLLGFLVHAMLESGQVAPATRLLLTAGFCGGFTTFSTFSLETVRLLESGASRTAVAYVVASVTLSAAAAFLGIWGARLLLSLRGR